jgi:3-oxoadipate enol-lactonase
MELLVRDLAGLLNELNIQKTHLVGLGLGGAIVQAFAIEQPQRLHALPACCCRAKMVPEFAEMWHKLRERWRTRAWKSSSADRAALVLRRVQGGGIPKCCRTCANMIRAPHARLPRGSAAFLGLNLEDKLPQIKAARPLCFPGRRTGSAARPPLMAELARRCPARSHRSVPKAAHIREHSRTSGFNKEVGDFLRRLDLANMIAPFPLLRDSCSWCVMAQPIPRSRCAGSCRPVPAARSTSSPAHRAQACRVARPAGDRREPPGANSMIGAREVGALGARRLHPVPGVVNNALNDLAHARSVLHPEREAGRRDAPLLHAARDGGASRGAGEFGQGIRGARQVAGPTSSPTRPAAPAPSRRWSASCSS